jgi:hypothetical protein
VRKSGQEVRSRKNAGKGKEIERRDIELRHIDITAMTIEEEDDVWHLGCIFSCRGGVDDDSVVGGG